MSYCEDFSHGLGVAYYREDDLAPSLWTHEDICGIYVRLLNLGFLDPQLVPDRLMEYYGMRLGHHARLAREEREQRARNAEHQRQVVAETRHGWVNPLVRDIVNSTAVAHGIPPPYPVRKQLREATLVIGREPKPAPKTGEG